MEHFAKIGNCIQPLTIFAKHIVSRGIKCAFNKIKQNPDALSLISQKIGL